MMIKVELFFERTRLGYTDNKTIEFERKQIISLLEPINKALVEKSGFNPSFMVNNGIIVASQYSNKMGVHLVACINKNMGEVRGIMNWYCKQLEEDKLIKEQNPEGIKIIYTRSL